jgi:predicted nucleic acid-binding protein
MPERIVINTGPLVALARMDALDVVGRLPFDFLCPREVRAELEEGARRGHIPVAPGWLRVAALEAPLSPVAVAALDAGEAAVIQLALDLAVSWVCMDEWKGRRASASAGLKVVGAQGPRLHPLHMMPCVILHPDLGFTGISQDTMLRH